MVRTLLITLGLLVDVSKYNIPADQILFLFEPDRLLV